MPPALARLGVGHEGGGKSSKKLGLVIGGLDVALDRPV
jgi:hypothetical protein